MIVILAAIIGAAIGSLTAKRRKGKLADILLYGTVYGLIFALIGLFITLIIHRSAM